MTTRKTSGRTTKRSTSSAKRRPARTQKDYAIQNEVTLIVIFAVAVLLFLCNFGIIGSLGNAISKVLFGLFGLMAYAAPLLIFAAILFGSVNTGNFLAAKKLIAGIVLFLVLGIVFDMISGVSKSLTSYDMKEIYTYAAENRTGGGIISGSLNYALFKSIGTVGTIVVILVLLIAAFVVLTEKSFVSGVKKSSERLLERTREDNEFRKEAIRKRQEELEEKRIQDKEVKIEQKEIHKLQKDDEKVLRMNKKVSGVMTNTTLTRTEKTDDDIHEIILNGFEPSKTAFDFDQIRLNGVETATIAEVENQEEESDIVPEKPVIHTERRMERSKQNCDTQKTAVENVSTIDEDIQKAVHISTKYTFPPMNLLTKNPNKGAGEGAKQLKQTALRLQQTLETFGVKATITDISQGPTVTRYELQPELGVKVSKIVSLADDIKLNLAATDIRIEAPIPGKAAVGIEVPNKENSAVLLRDLIDTEEFKSFESNLAFAVGKDIAGKVVVYDIDKMPHMLIAGATGSGKSVCINTLIMSILYKAHPDNVKLMMIDPKVVELSVYNGIPHLLIPVVTEPKKASAALNWAVAEMSERYKKFADMNVRDLKGYNEAVVARGEDEIYKKMPAIVIIVDELADLMMVASNEVEESICRLSQLARAAGIHLVIATQRPSVDVITGLIKANMPSRLAFAVSSGVDSRTILDMNGAEKLLGKGDMLFFPKGYKKPVRMQGGFVSDKEVSDVVEYLKRSGHEVYDSEIETKINSIHSQSNSGSGMNDEEAESCYDSYFAEAGKYIIDKDKASIGMLQRVFKIGFNRAARIMDQLCEAGVVSQEDGTKPRKVLMSIEQYEQFIEENL